jgi:hypothetical protein
VRIASAQLADGEEFDDPLLRLVEAVVPRIERFLHFLEVDLLFARPFVPRKR